MTLTPHTLCLICAAVAFFLEVILYTTPKLNKTALAFFFVVLAFLVPLTW